MELEKRKKKIWAKHEKATGHHIKPVVRQYIENTLFHGIYDSVALEDLDASIPDYLSLLNLWVMNSCSRRQLETESAGNTTKKRYRKCFERRLHLVDFVTAEVLNLNNLVDQSFAPRKRIKWKPICDKWNKAHLYDPMTLAVLKVEFYRAIVEKDIQREFFARKEKEIADTMAPIMGSLVESISGISNAFRKMSESLLKRTP